MAAAEDASSIQGSISPVPGDVILTTFGVAVVTRIPQGENEGAQQLFEAKLWRMPFKSIGSSTTGFLRMDTIIRRLPAAPGMTTKTTCQKNGIGAGKEVLVHSYSASDGIFLVSEYKGLSAKPSGPLSLDDGKEDVEMEGNLNSEEQPLVSMTAQDIEPARSAKFYPLIVDLMRRGDMAASATSVLLNKANVSNLTEKSDNMIESLSPNVPEIPITNEGVAAVTDSVKKALPNNDEVKQIYNMLKDEELTVLLQKGQERLRQLVTKEIPEAKRIALEKTGIVIADGSSESVMSVSQAKIAESQGKALAALDKLLSDNVNMDIETIQRSLGTEFTTMFDSMAQAAKSDSTLNSIFDTISSKTSEWQEETGRLMATKSASLFFEGAQRLQARAANLFGKDQFSWATDVGAHLTKAFTEGDAAVARLKSIELGDAVRGRLVEAIELRSSSEGGLDAIIAGALSTVKGTNVNGVASDNLQAMVKNLQSNATSSSKNAHETLLSMLSQKSIFRDEAVLHLERSLVNLEGHLGEDMSPEDIARIARGEGGTAALFQPIAKKAAKQINNQLDAATKSVTDPNVINVLTRVRKIMSGEMSISSLVDEAVNVLNNEKVVQAGEHLVKHGESILDAIEGTKGNKVVEDVIQVVGKSGIKKEELMKHVENLNINDILSTAGSAVTDEQARRELLSSATDSALDFLLRILPSMSVPPFDGVKDGLVYHISNLSMQGFKVKKENIVVEIAGIRAEKKSSENLRSLDDEKGMASESEAVPVIEGGSKTAKELLIIDVSDISALLNDAVWNFEQTYLPYLKGKGKSNVKLSEGSIRLTFELRRRKVQVEDSAPVDGEPQTEWEPVLCLNNRTCSIGEVDLILQGEGKVTWILNKLAHIFKAPLRDYVVRTIINVLTNRSGVLLEKLNENLGRYWGLIMKTAKISMDDLVEVSADVVTKRMSDVNANEVELVWRERLPLGMNLLTNDNSGHLKVVDFPRGSQARKVCTEKKIDADIFAGATVVAVNGSRFEEQADLLDALRDPSRPKSVHFALSNAEDAERVRSFVEGDKSFGGADDNGDLLDEDKESEECTVSMVEIVEEGDIGVEFAPALDGCGLVVKSFFKTEGGSDLAAEKTGQIHVGDVLSYINGKLVLGENGKGMQLAMSRFEEEGEKRPLTLGFIKPYLFSEVFSKPSAGVAEFGGPSELVLVQKKVPSGVTRIMLQKFKNVDGMGEHGGVLIGDHLFFVNGTPVGAGTKLYQNFNGPSFDEVMGILEDPGSYPIALTFARPGQVSNRWNATNEFDAKAAATFCVTAEHFVELGCTFDVGPNEDEIVVMGVNAVSGPVQTQLKSRGLTRGGLGLCIESVNGQIIPSYATPDIIMSALQRSWKSDGHFEVLLCNDTRKDWMKKLLESDSSE